MDLLNDEFPFAKTALSGKHALIFGASKGIGAATAKMMAMAGADVTLCARNEDSLVRVVSQINEFATGKISHAVIDLEDLDAIDGLIENLLQDKPPVHILINNSGGPPGGPLLDNSVVDFHAPFTRHLHAAHKITKLLVPQMEASGYGRIIQIISTSVREPIPNLGLSNTLRGAMASWAKSLSRELPPCITINNVLPGFTDTERLGSLANSINQKTGKSLDEIHEGWMGQVPIERLVDPMETASAITYLALPAAGAIRGVSLAVDGGRLRSI